MNARHLLLAALIAAWTGVWLVDASVAQELDPFDGEPGEHIPLFNAVDQATSVSAESSIHQTTMTVDQLRQARALHRANQRVARLEYNLWMGYEPLRPNWNAVPMMSSRYTNRRVYVPVYVYGR